MKKLLTLALALATAMNFSYANNEHNKDDKKNTLTSSFQKRYNNKTLDNWFISAGVGAQVYFGDHDKQIGIGKRITPSFELNGGKWINDTFGIRASISGAKMKGLTQSFRPDGNNGLSTGKKYRDSDHLWFQTFNYMNVHADFLFNWTNDAYGYDPKRMYNLIPYAGIGFITVLNKQKGTSFTPNLGVLQTFKINDQLGVNLDVRGNIYPDKVDGEIGGRNFEGSLSITAGITYSIK